MGQEHNHSWAEACLSDCPEWHGCGATFSGTVNWPLIRSVNGHKSLQGLLKPFEERRVKITIEEIR
jgi:hypothetical protein